MQKDFLNVSNNCSIVLPTPPKLGLMSQTLQIKDMKQVTSQPLAKEDMKQSSLQKSLIKSQTMLRDGEKSLVDKRKTSQIRSKDDSNLGKLVINMKNKTVASQDLVVVSLFYICVILFRSLQ